MKAGSSGEPGKEAAMPEMFGETLLDSSPSRAPVLQTVHWLISCGIGVLGFLAWYFGAPLLLGPPASARILFTQSVLFGATPIFCFALIICYVYADTTHLGFSPLLWIAMVVVLNLVGFIIYLIYSASKTGNWKRATLPIAYIFEVIVVGVLILVPLIYTQALPKAQLMTFLAAPPPPPPPPPPAAPPPKIIVHQVSMKDLMKAPTVIPKTIEKVREQPTPQESVGVVGGVPGGVPGGQVGGVMGGMIGSAPPPPPPPKATTPKRIRIGGQVEQAKRIFAPTPEYPPLAKMARIQGTVRLQAVISKEGTVQNLTVMSGHPLLVKSALDAVKQWRYQPTLLNGEPVEVVTEIDVVFTLAE
jgi:periplasmic protein TonB